MWPASSTGCHARQSLLQEQPVARPHLYCSTLVLSTGLDMVHLRPVRVAGRELLGLQPPSYAAASVPTLWML